MSNQDPFEAANEAKEPSKHFFGLNMFDIWYCALIKGQGKVPYDPQMHQNQKQFTAVHISIAPLPGSGAKFPLERQLISESKEWAGVILPSIHALNLTPRDLNGKYVHVEIVPTGETYTDKQGVVKTKTTPKYVEVYTDENACYAASSAFFGNHNTEQPEEEAFSATAPTNNGEKAVAEKFLPALVNQANKDPQKVAELLVGNNLVGKYFNINSPEVIKLITA